MSRQLPPLPLNLTSRQRWRLHKDFWLAPRPKAALSEHSSLDVGLWKPTRLHFEPSLFEQQLAHKLLSSFSLNSRFDGREACYSRLYTRIAVIIPNVSNNDCVMNKSYCVMM